MSPEGLEQEIRLGRFWKTTHIISHNCPPGCPVLDVISGALQQLIEMREVEDGELQGMVLRLEINSQDHDLRA